MVFWNQIEGEMNTNSGIDSTSARKQPSKRIEAENAFSRSEARLRSIINTAVDAIFTINEEGIIDMINLAAEKMFGYSADELIGQNVSMLMPEPHSSQHTEFVRRYVQTGEAKIIGIGREAKARRKDGTTFPIDIAVSELRFNEERIFTGIIRDITVRKRAEQRLAAEHAVARVLAQATSLQQATSRILQTLCENLDWDLGEFFVVDSQNDVLRCVEFWHAPEIHAPDFEAATRSITFSPGTGLPGRVWITAEPAWIADLSKETNFPRKQVALKEGVRAALGFPILLGEEVLGVMDFFSRDMHQPDEELSHMFSAIGSQVGQFIERKRVEEELRASEINYREIFDAANDAIFVHDLQTGDILDVNRRMCEMYGCTPEEARFLKVADLSDKGGGFAQEHAARRIRKAAAGEPQLFEWRAKNRKTGQPFWVEVSLRQAIIRGRDRLLAVVRDITERKHLQQQLEHHSQQLRLFEERLRQAEKLMIMGMIASEIAHEVGTPLNIISGRVELLSEREKSNEHIRKDLEVINQQIERITKIIRKRLDVTRHKKGQTQIVNLHHLLSGLIDFLRLQLEKASTRIDFSVPQDVCIQGDEDQLQQVFINILINAIQAMDTTGTLSIRSTSGAGENSHYVEITIKDTGTGISPENLDKIFEPFFSTKQDQGGTGLGLSVAQDIIKKHGGEIFVESKLGEGTTFHILLPAPVYSEEKSDS